MTDLDAARYAARQYRSDARRLRAEAELAELAGYPATRKHLRYFAAVAAHAAISEMRAALLPAKT